MPGGRFFPGASNNGRGRGFDRNDRRDSRYSPRDRRDTGEPEEASQEEMLSRSSRDRGRRKLVKKKKARVFFHQSLTRIALPKILTKARYMSAPLAIKYVESGRVRINSRVVMSIYYEVNLRKERVTIDEVPIEFPRQLSYYVYNKPRNMICEKGDPLFDSLFSPEQTWSFPFGRLTRAVSGLVIITNDPRLKQTQHMVDDQLQKEYRVRINKVMTDQQLDELRGGVLVGEDYFVPLRVSVHQTNVDSMWLDITVLDDSYHSFFSALKALGCEVMKMRRLRIALLHENMVPLGEWREMSGHEVSMLGINRFMRGILPPEPPPPPRPEREQRPWEKKRSWGKGGDRGRGDRSERGERGGDRSRPSRHQGDDRPRGDRGSRPEGGDRPRGDRPQGERTQGGDRPRNDRQGGDRPRGDRPQGERPQGDRRPSGDRPRGDRPQGPRPGGGDRPQGDRPRGEGRRDERPRDERPRDERPRDELPRDERPRSDQRPRGDERPRGDRPGGDRPRDERPRNDDRPRNDRRQEEPRESRGPRDDRNSGGHDNRPADREPRSEAPRPSRSEPPAERRPESPRRVDDQPPPREPRSEAPRENFEPPPPARRSRRGPRPEPPAES